jgi:hypothetical protein
MAKVTRGVEYAARTGSADIAGSPAEQLCWGAVLVR